MAQELGKPRLVDLAAPREASVAVHVAAAMLPDPIVDRRVRRPGVEADDAVFAAPPGDVADAAEIEHGRVCLGSDAAQKRDVIERGERRALAAGTHVGLAEIKSHVDAGEARHELAVAKLARRAQGSRARRPVQHGLAVKADDGDP